MIKKLINILLILCTGCFTAAYAQQQNAGKQTFEPVDYPPGFNANLDVFYRDSTFPNCRMDIYFPSKTEKPVPIVIHLHGGGWNHGSKESQRGFGMFFRNKMAVANVEYRMTGDALAPAAVEDVRAALIYLLHNAEELNIDPNKIILHGGSAGAHLALVAGYLQNNRVYDKGTKPYKPEIRILAVIDKYGPSDLVEFAYYGSLKKWLGTKAGDKKFVASLSPVELVNHKTPPTFIVHGDADNIVPISQSVTLQHALEKAGVKHQFIIIPNGGHGGFSSEWNAKLSNEIICFINEIIKNQ